MKYIVQLSVAIAALIILGGSLYYSQEERGLEREMAREDRLHEAQRADRDRELQMSLMQMSIDKAAEDRKAQHKAMQEERVSQKERVEIFLGQQEKMVTQGEYLVEALNNQGEIMEQLVHLNTKRTAEQTYELTRAMDKANADLLKVLAAPKSERKDIVDKVFDEKNGSD